MKRLLNTLFVTSQGTYLSRKGETVKVKLDGKTLMSVPIHTLSGIVCFGRVSCSPQLMGLCGERGVLLSFLSERGRFYARVQGPVQGNVLLRREQYRRADDLTTAGSTAATVAIGKLANARTVLLRGRRDRAETPAASRLASAAQRLARLVQTLHTERDLQQVRGAEGEAAATYFSCFNDLITSQEESFRFVRRSRRPPRDNINALLSFLYTLLMHDVTAALEGVGLDPAVGCLHRDRPGRMGLALDLMEELRPVIADRTALSLINRGQVRPGGFTRSEGGAVWMNDNTRKTILVAYQRRKQEELTHPFLNERLSIGLIPHVQALLFARYLRDDLDAYPPFLWK